MYVPLLDLYELEHSRGTRSSNKQHHVDDLGRRSRIVARRQAARCWLEALVCGLRVCHRDVHCWCIIAGHRH